MTQRWEEQTSSFPPFALYELPLVLLPHWASRSLQTVNSKLTRALSSCSKYERRSGWGLLFTFKRQCAQMLVDPSGPQLCPGPSIFLLRSTSWYSLPSVSPVWQGNVWTQDVLRGGPAHLARSSAAAHKSATPWGLSVQCSEGSAQCAAPGKLGPTQGSSQSNPPPAATGCKGDMQRWQIGGPGRVQVLP